MTVDLNPIILAIIGAAVTLLTVYMTRVNSTATKLIEKTDQIHGVVNSNQSAMQKSIDTLTAEVLKLSTANATLSESARSTEIAAARAEVPQSASPTQRAAPAPPLKVTVVQGAGEPVPVVVTDEKIGEIVDAKIEEAGHPPKEGP